MINRVCLWPNSDQIDFNFDFDFDFVWTLSRASDVGGMKWIGHLCIDRQLGIYFVRIKRGTFFYISAQTRHRRWCYQWVTELGRSANGHIRVQCLINQNLTVSEEHIENCCDEPLPKYLTLPVSASAPDAIVGKLFPHL